MKFYTPLTAGQMKLKARFEREDRLKRWTVRLFWIAVLALAGAVWAVRYFWRML